MVSIMRIVLVGRGSILGKLLNDGLIVKLSLGVGSADVEQEALVVRQHCQLHLIILFDR